MCLIQSNLYLDKKWNWEGDRIMQTPIIPSSRKVPRTRIQYDTDIRGFLMTKDNAVIKKEIGKLIKSLKLHEANFFCSRLPGSFDFRVQKILEFVSNHISYEYRQRAKDDEWLFPDETLAKKTGDCEDRSFLLAAMIIASGVSGYVVRVALGKLYDHNNKKNTHDHVWVMYKNEVGRWTLLESQIFEKKNRHLKAEKLLREYPDLSESIEYVPYYVFNHDHLWRLDDNTLSIEFQDYLNNRTFWKKFDPRFAAGVHNSIYDLAFHDLSWEKRFWMKSVSLAVDTVQTYDPCDHFDNGYISQGWDLVDKRLAKKTLTGLAYAAHTIADFYAHSTYACFAKKKKWKPGAL